MIKGIIFDLDDTVYDYEKINSIAIEKLGEYTCTRFSITMPEFQEAFEYARKATKDGMPECASQHNRMIYCQKTLEYLKINPVLCALEMYDVYWNTMLEQMELNQGVMEILEKCREKGYKIGICTDLTAHIQHRKIRKLGLTPFVDYIVTSEEAGAEKPDIKMFQLILKKMELKPEETVFVGDSFKKDILGAYRAGMNPIWYNQKGAKIPEIECQFKEIHNFYEIEVCLE